MVSNNIYGEIKPEFCPMCSSTDIDLQGVSSTNSAIGFAFDYYCRKCTNSGTIDLDGSLDEL